MINRILIVDDSQSWLSFHTELIKELYGKIFEITVANSAEMANRIIRQNVETPFNVVITDLQMENTYMPQLAGEWLVENIKLIKEYNNTHIIIISGMPNIEQIAAKYNVECIAKSRLVSNKLFIKFMFEKLMPFLSKI